MRNYNGSQVHCQSLSLSERCHYAEERDIGSFIKGKSNRVRESVGNWSL